MKVKKRAECREERERKKDRVNKRKIETAGSLKYFGGIIIIAHILLIV